MGVPSYQVLEAVDQVVQGGRCPVFVRPRRVRELARGHDLTGVGAERRQHAPFEHGEDDGSLSRPIDLVAFCVKLTVSSMVCSD